MSKNKDQENLIDYLEGEMSSSFRKDYSVFLKDSSQLLNELKKLSKIKNVLSANRTPEIPEDEAYYRKLESKIMSQISDVPRVALWKKLRISRNLQWGLAFLVIMGAVVFSVSNLKKKKGLNLGANVASDLLFSTSAQNLNSYLNSAAAIEGSDDILFEVAAKRLHSLTEGEATAVINRFME